MTTKRRKTTTKGVVPPKPTSRKKAAGEVHIIVFMLGIGLLSTIFLFALFYCLEKLSIPNIKSVAYYRPLQTSYIYDSHGAVIDRIFKENRSVIPLKSMPPHLIKAFVSAEDGRFYEHPGLDFLSVLRAMVANIRSGRRGQGGSTITQQVARSLLLTPEKSYIRKFKEAILAWRIDKLLSKDEIIYIYLNQIYLGGGAYGVEAAARTYFDKLAIDLTLGESALLAGLPQAPSRYSPLNHLGRAVKRQRYVLNRMVAEGYITEGQANRAFGEEVRIHKPLLSQNRENGYFIEVVKKRAANMLGVGLYHAGVMIYTTLDSKIQRQAVDSLRRGVKASFNRQPRMAQNKRKVPQGALVSLEVSTSRVKALVGGVDYAVTPYDRATRARRPAGSVFKPLIYGTALENGWNPTSVVVDAPISIKRKGEKLWQPKNFSGQFHGPVTLATALTHSYNSVAVRLLQRTGVTNVHNTARASGISAVLTPDLSLALGAVDVSLLEMTGAYLPFICQGMFRPPLFIDRIEDINGDIVGETRRKANRVFSAKTATEMTHMLGQVISDGTGRRARGLGKPSAGKTGTSNDNRDAWFVGFTNRMLTGIWVGHDDNQGLGRGENGGHTAAPIWLDFMRRVETLR